MSDLISKKAVIEAVDKIKIKIEPDVLNEYSIYEVLSYLCAKVETMVRVRIENVPTVEAKEVVHGKWETDRFGLDRSVCSICGAVYEGDSGNFCPKCGADMQTSAE